MATMTSEPSPGCQGNPIVVSEALTGEVLPAPLDAVTEIRAEHEAVEESLGRALRSAVRIGELLSREFERRKYRHGDGFQKWIADNLDSSYATANSYMKMFANSGGLLTSGAQTKAEAMRYLTTGSIEITDDIKEQNRRRNAAYVRGQALKGGIGKAHANGPIGITQRMLDQTARALCDELSPFGYPETPTSIVLRHAQRILVKGLAGITRDGTDTAEEDPE
jgi:hypothetical protein